MSSEGGAPPPKLDGPGIRAEYLGNLRRKLTMATLNSKPTINSFTTAAGTYSKHASFIIEAVEMHIAEVPEPQLKQYSLYLLDSICKNLRGRFAEAAGVNLKQTFTTVYNAVQRDAALKKSLFKVLATWHDVFPKDLVLSIEFFLKSQGETPLAPVAILPAASSGSKSAAPNPVGGKSAPKPRDAPPTSRPPPHRQEQRPPAPQPREPQAAPAWAGHGAWDPAAPPPVVQGAYYPPPAAQGGYYPPPGPAGGWAQPYYPPHEYPAPDPAAPYPYPPAHDWHAGPPAHHGWPQGQYPAAYPPAAAVNAPLLPPVRPDVLASLFSGKSSSSAAAPSAPSFAAVSLGKPVVPLTNEGLKRTYPGAVESLYTSMTRQCTTCGLRFDKTGASDARMAAHLDWHFRMNKRDQERAQRVEIRDWFVPLDVWRIYRVSDLPDEQTAESETASAVSSSAASVAPAAPAAPSTVQAHPDVPGDRVCGTCGENLTPVLDNETDLWVYHHAVRVNGTVYHIDCAPAESDAQEEEGGASRKRKATDEHDAAPAKAAKSIAA